MHLIAPRSISLESRMSYARPFRHELRQESRLEAQILELGADTERAAR